MVETHSSLLLLGIQTLVAQQKCASELVKLHWFTQDSAGKISIRSTDLTSHGVFADGDCPEDFGDVEMNAQNNFLDAVELSDSEIYV